MDQMISLLNRLNVGMKNALHNWVVLSLLMLAFWTSVSVIVRYQETGADIPPGVLQLILYELGAVLSAVGVVGGMHTYKAVKGVEGEPPAAAPAAAPPDAGAAR